MGFLGDIASLIFSRAAGAFSLRRKDQAAIDKIAEKVQEFPPWKDEAKLEFAIKLDSEISKNPRSDRAWPLLYRLSDLCLDSRSFGAAVIYAHWGVRLRPTYRHSYYGLATTLRETALKSPRLDPELRGYLC